MVADWDCARREHAQGKVVILTDASNAELDRLNAMAQARRVQAGELVQHRVVLVDRPYALAAGDRVILTGHLRSPGQQRVENGTPGEVLGANEHEHRVELRTAEPQPRDVSFDAREFSDVRLAYAQHLYKAQGATVDRALLLTGGWQTDRERAYVGLTRARERTDVYVSREDLGEQGLDPGAITRLGERMSVSRAQQASVTRQELAHQHDGEHAREAIGEGADRERSRTTEVEDGRARESQVGRILREAEERERERAIGLDDGIGLG